MMQQSRPSSNRSSCRSSSSGTRPSRSPTAGLRHEVCEIAGSTSLVSSELLVRPWDEIPEGAVVLPVDDDDWFAPDIVRMLESQSEPDRIGLRWTPSYLEVPVGLRHRLDRLRERHFGAPPRHLCATNGYAFVKQAGMENIGLNHLAASDLFGARERACGRALGRTQRGQPHSCLTDDAVPPAAIDLTPRCAEEVSTLSAPLPGTDGRRDAVGGGVRGADGAADGAAPPSSLIRHFLISAVRPARFERATSASAGQRSIP